MGNRLSKTDSSTGTTTSVYDAANRLLSTTGTAASTYSNDADGNTLTGGGRTDAWDSQNRLISCTKGGTYGADGLRRSSTVNGITTYYVYSTLCRNTPYHQSPHNMRRLRDIFSAKRIVHQKNQGRKWTAALRTK